MHHLPDDRPGPDDRHLDDDVVEALRAAAAAASPSARAIRPGRSRSCRLPAASRRPRDRRREVGEVDECGDRGSGSGLRDSGSRFGFQPSPVRIPNPAVPSPEPRVLAFTIASASCSTAIIPRPSRSTLTSPMSAQSSLSHWMTTRSGMLAFSSGTTSSRRPWQMTMPPECWPRWRGRSWMRCPELGRSA